MASQFKNNYVDFGRRRPELRRLLLAGQGALRFRNRHQFSCHLATKCVDCQETAGEEGIKSLNQKLSASTLVDLKQAKNTEDEYWQRALDDFLVYLEVKGCFMEIR